MHHDIIEMGVDEDYRYSCWLKLMGMWDTYYARYKNYIGHKVYFYSNGTYDLLLRQMMKSKIND